MGEVVPQTRHQNGVYFLPKGPNKSVVEIEFPKGLSNPPSMVFEHKGLTNPSKKDVTQKTGTMGEVVPQTRHQNRVYFFAERA